MSSLRLPRNYVLFSILSLGHLEIPPLSTSPLLYCLFKLYKIFIDFKTKTDAMCWGMYYEFTQNSFLFLLYNLFIEFWLSIDHGVVYCSIFYSCIIFMPLMFYSCIISSFNPLEKSFLLLPKTSTPPLVPMIRSTPTNKGGSLVPWKLAFPPITSLNPPS